MTVVHVVFANGDSVTGRLLYPEFVYQMMDPAGYTNLLLVEDEVFFPNKNIVHVTKYDEAKGGGDEA
jgi:hypothetical protein